MMVMVVGVDPGGHGGCCCIGGGGCCRCHRERARVVENDWNYTKEEKNT